MQLGKSKSRYYNTQLYISIFPISNSYARPSYHLKESINLGFLQSQLLSSVPTPGKMREGLPVLEKSLGFCQFRKVRTLVKKLYLQSFPKGSSCPAENCAQCAQIWNTTFRMSIKNKKKIRLRYWVGFGRLKPDTTRRPSIIG